MTEEKKQEAIKRIQDGLKCSKEEAEEVFSADCQIEHNEAMPFDLTKEQIKEVKQYVNVGTKKKPTAYNFNKRTRKENVTKANIINELYTFLNEKAEFAPQNIEITNKERQILFKINDTTFELTLIQKRK